MTPERIAELRRLLVQSPVVYQDSGFRLANSLADGLAEALNALEYEQYVSRIVDVVTTNLPTCGTAYRGCDPMCPKELSEAND